MTATAQQRAEFIEKNLGLVHACAGRFRGRGIEYEDLYGAGCVGLVKACDGFDESRGLCFSTYAVPVILGEIKKLFRDGGSVKVSRGLKELGMKVAAVREKLPVRAEAVELVGLVSNICVISNACVLQSCYPAASIVVDAALTASFDLEAHEKALDVMRSFQVEVINDREQEGI